MASFAFVALVRTLDPEPPNEWGITGDCYGTEITSEDDAQRWVCREWARQQGADPQNLHVVAFSAFNTTGQDAQ